ncbi:MAG TPA: hypothetical protein ENJ10_09315 [Caldithrix abyssi]|uniref:DUF5777 domain-containing protein n=1 Tax=Caldithrix abyssi TaxID=187145 RepID=A0A7V1PUL3_CALAY|nr:hypothetical protein [Caldithrix abyssi]
MRFKGILFFLFLSSLLCAQPSWQREERQQKKTLELFHSIQLANLPTTESLARGDFFYEIAHRFGTVSSGIEGFFGLDGPVNMRTALAYGFSDRLMVTLGRSNIMDNVDLKVKYKLEALESSLLPMTFALQAGVALNSEVYGLSGKRRVRDKRNLQYFGQFIVNGLFWEKKLGVGLAPSVVYNSFIFAGDYRLDTKYTLTLPLYAQYYFNRMWSLFVEYGMVTGGWQGGVTPGEAENFKSSNSLGAGVAIETGGHVFYLFVTNNRRLNSSQYLIGADAPFRRDRLVLAFSITRVL